MKPKKEVTVGELFEELNLNELKIHNPESYNKLISKVRDMELEIDRLTYCLREEQMRTDRAKERIIKLLFEEEDND